MHPPPHAGGSGATAWRAATAGAWVLAAAVLAFGWAFGARTASGADSLGYVSQAYLWLDGDLSIDNRLAREAPWPFAPESLTPLGYRSRDTTTSVPTYPPGVPLVMAAFAWLFGACGPYLLAPVFGGMLVGATFGLGARLTGRPGVALMAAVLMATSPAFLVNVIVPMSDTATTAMWTLSLCALTWPGLRSASLGGLAAGCAVLMRPNLAPLVIAGVVAAEAWRAGTDRRGARAAVFLLCVVPAALFIAWLNHQLYGSPWLSGYGAAGDLYAARHVGTNLRQFGVWLLQTEWPALLLLLPLALARFRPHGLPRTSGPLVLFAMLVAGSYLFYQPFDVWWYLRFLLPAYPLMFLAMAVGGSALLEVTTRRRALVSLTVATLALGVVRIVPYSLEIFTIGRGEDRYAAVAEFVTRGLPPNAVFIAMQHSGTIRFYAARPTLQYEWLSAARLSSSIAWLRDRGYRPYIVLENWEEPRFRRRFAEAGPAGRLELRTIAELKGVVDVRIYDPLETVAAPGTFRMEPRHGPCAAPAPHWRAPSVEPR